MTDILSIPSVYAKEIGVTAQTVNNWIDKDGTVKPVQTIGHVKLFVREELESLRVKYGKSRSDYVHPDKYKAMEDLHRSAAVRLAERDTELRELQDKYNILLSEYNAIQDQADASEDQAEREMNMLITGESLTNDEYDEKYPSLDDSNILN